MGNANTGTDGDFKEPEQTRVTDTCFPGIPGSFCMVIFGASGDLVQRKLLPALYKLDRDDLFPGNFVILGCARTDMGNSAFRDMMRDAVKTSFPADFDMGLWRKFSTRLHYVRTDYGDEGSFRGLRKRSSPSKESTPQRETVSFISQSLLLSTDRSSRIWVQRAFHVKRRGIPIL